MRAQLGFTLLVMFKYSLKIAECLRLLIYYIAEKITNTSVLIMICTVV